MVPRLTKEQLLQIPPMVEEGKTYYEIGLLLGGFKKITISKAVKRLRLAGYTVNNKSGRKKVL